MIEWRRLSAQALMRIFTYTGQTALMDSLYYAAAEGDIDRFKISNLDQLLTPNNNTILHIYITAQRVTIELNSANLRKISEEGTHRKEEFVLEILEMCPNLIWKANNKGDTLLHVAARHGYADIVKVLIAECKKAYHKDQEHGIEVTRLMLGKTKETKDTALHEAGRYNHLDVVKILTKADPDLFYDVNSSGETPLYLAAERGCAEIVEEILCTCRSPTDNGPFGRTALHAAVICKDTGKTWWWF